MELLDVIVSLIQPNIIMYMIIGVIIGMIIGSLPGLSVTMSIAILTPVTFWLSPEQGLAMLIGIYNSGVWAGGISAILINTPGTPASIMSSLDGYKMTKKGEAGLAIGINTIYSVLGGIISSLVLIFIAFPVANFALKFGPPEYFALAIFGLSMMISVSEKSKVKGIMIGVFGFLISTIGLDPIVAFPRFTFGSVNLLQGIPFIAVMIGLFGVGEVLYQIYDSKNSSGEGLQVKVGRIIPTLKEFKRFAPFTICASLLSVVIGAIPGTGGDIASVICWNQAKKLSKHGEEYGEGSAEGLAVTCASNNGVIGGAMTTMLTLGIPGDAATAVLIGSLMMYGLQPGPMLFVQHVDFVYSLMGMMLVANILILIFGLLTAKASVKFLKLKQETIWVGVLILSIIGSYAINNSLMDVTIMLSAGVLGFLLRKMDYPIAPFILAVILGPMAESNLRRTIAMTNGAYDIFFTRPIALILILLTIIALFGGVIKEYFIINKLSSNNKECNIK